MSIQYCSNDLVNFTDPEGTCKNLYIDTKLYRSSYIEKKSGDGKCNIMVKQIPKPFKRSTEYDRRVKDQADKDERTAERKMVVGL